MKKYTKTLIKILPITALVILFSYTGKVLAAPLQNKTDTMSRLGNSSAETVYSDHTIQFTTPSGIASGETVVIELDALFNGTTHPNGSLDFNDVDMYVNATPDGSCGGTTQTLVGAAPGDGEWGAVFSGTGNTILTITSGGATSIVGAGDEVCILIGQDATGGSANSQYANPTASGTYTISIGAGVDSGELTVSIIDNDRVTITAEVTETITFAISDYTVGFGNLLPTIARFATTASGANGPTPTSAHSMTVSTNGSTGYEITYLGSTLTNQNSDTIPAATITGVQDGTPGTEQFAIGFTNNPDATIVSAYNQGLLNYSFVPDTETPFASENGPSETETITAFYLANISGITPAGSYSTSLTYVATANF